jgi:hypothetical protein
VIRVAERVATRLVEKCRKGGPLYARNPRAVAQASRTARLLLHALSALNRVLPASASGAVQRKG